MKLTLNLASRSYLNRRALYAAYAVLVAALVLLLAMNVGFWLRGRSQARQIETRLGELDRDLAGGQEVAADFSPEAYKALLAEVAFANEVLARDSFRWTALLDRLEEVVPKKVIIRGIQPDHKDGSLRLSGQARRVSDLRQFLDNLIASPDFNDVYLMQQAREKGKGDSGVGFAVVVRGAF